MITIDIDRATLEDCLRSKIAQLERAKQKARSPKFAELYEHDIKNIRRAADTMKETK